MGVGEVCGAISGAALAIGLLYGQDQPGAAHHLTREFMRQYAEQNGAVRCIDITGVDMGSAIGLLLYLVKGGKKKCNRVVGGAIQVLLDQLEDWES
jgi:C_GCAxxG_C_C family probable redox protein